MMLESHNRVEARAHFRVAEPANAKPRRQTWWDLSPCRFSPWTPDLILAWPVLIHDAASWPSAPSDSPSSPLNVIVHSCNHCVMDP